MGMGMSKNLNNAEAVAFYGVIAEYLERTKTLWVDLSQAAGYSPSVRSSSMSQGKGMLAKTHDDFQAAMDANPNGIQSEHGAKLDLLDHHETVALANDLRAYIERTGSEPIHMARMVGRDGQGITNLLANPVKISRTIAGRYRKLMDNHPDGVSGRALPLTRPEPGIDIEARRREVEQERQRRFAQINADAVRRYGRPLGRPLWEMVA